MTSIRISDHTLQLLRIRKIHNRHKSYDELIATLIQKDTATPKSYTCTVQDTKKDQ